MRIPNLFLIVVTILTAHASGAVIIAGDVNLPGAACTLTITHDIVLTVNQGQSITGAFIVFDNLLYASDGSLDTPALLGNLNFTRSIGKETSSAATIYDTFPTGLNDISSQDVSLSFNPGTNLAIGEKFTILAGTYSFTGVDDLSPHIAGTFAGQISLRTVMADASVRMLPFPSLSPQPHSSEPSPPLPPSSAANAKS